MFPVICHGASKKIGTGDEIEIDIVNGIVKNLTKNEEYKSEALPKFAMEIVKAGGLLPYVKKKYKK